VLENDPEFLVVGRAQTGYEGLTLTRSLHPDLVLIDFDLPGLAGTAIASAITRSFPEIVTVFIAAHADFDHLLASAQAGAASAIRRDEEPGRLREILRGALNGFGRHYPWALHEFEAETSDGVRNRSVRLTDRQAATLDCLLHGLQTHEMPAALQGTRYSVRRDLDSLYDVLGVHEKIGAIAAAHERGWVHPRRGDPIVTVLRRGADGVLDRADRMTEPLGIERLLFPRYPEALTLNA
jgi:DNA-binding NarL/FixJ family response regulator